MDADFSIELGADDPVLDFPWSDPSGKPAFVDLKRHPEHITQVEEAQRFPELANFLRSMNSLQSAFESAKSDAWATTDLDTAEDVFHASHKFASYVDLVFSGIDRRRDYLLHKNLAGKWAELLRRAPEIAASAEICIRRCFLVASDELAEGFYFTLYVNGYGSDQAMAQKNWAIGLNLAGNAILQLSASREF